MESVESVAGASFVAGSCVGFAASHVATEGNMENAHAGAPLAGTSGALAVLTGCGCANEGSAGAARGFGTGCGLAGFAASHVATEGDWAKEYFGVTGLPPPVIAFGFATSHVATEGSSSNEPLGGTAWPSGFASTGKCAVSCSFSCMGDWSASHARRRTKVSSTTLWVADISPGCRQL